MSLLVFLEHIFLLKNEFLHTRIILKKSHVSYIVDNWISVSALVINLSYFQSNIDMI